jgi:hypothetical protein
MPIINNIPKRDLLLIHNKYEIINHNLEFNVVIYFLEKNKCQLIIRKIDNPSGWNMNLFIKIFGIINDKFEIISCGSSSKNSKIINIYTNIDLEYSGEQIQQIPKLIFQTTYSKNITDTLQLNSIYSFIDFNPDYEYNLLDDNDCRLFIKKNFDNELLIAYDLLVAGSFKADLFRYCYLYINGGCYFDCKQILRVPLKEVIKSDDDFLVCQDIGRHSYFNAVIISVKNNKRILNTIEMCKKKILNFFSHYSYYEKNFNNLILTLTGPQLFYDMIHNDINYNNIRFFHKINNFYTDYKKLVIESNYNKVIIYKNYNGYVHTGNGHYSHLWWNREILYKNYVTFDDYKFYIYSHNNNDLFNFYIFDKYNLIIERVDRNEGWGYNYKLKLIDEYEDKIYFIEMGSSENKFKILNIDCRLNFRTNSILDSFEIVDNNDNDVFDIKINNYNNLYKLMIRRVDFDKGWGQHLKINFKLINSDKIYFMEIGPSNYSVLVSDLTL